MAARVCVSYVYYVLCVCVCVYVWRFCHCYVVVKIFVWLLEFVQDLSRVGCTLTAPTPAATHCHHGGLLGVWPPPSSPDSSGRGPPGEHSPHSDASLWRVVIVVAAGVARRDVSQTGGSDHAVLGGWGLGQLLLGSGRGLLGGHDCPSPKGREAQVEVGGAVLTGVQARRGRLHDGRLTQVVVVGEAELDAVLHLRGGDGHQRWALLALRGLALRLVLLLLLLPELSAVAVVAAVDGVGMVRLHHAPHVAQEVARVLRGCRLVQQQLRVGGVAAAVGQLTHAAVPSWPDAQLLLRRSLEGEEATRGDQDESFWHLNEELCGALERSLTCGLCIS